MLLVCFALHRPGYATTDLLEPTQRSLGEWVGIHGIHEGLHLQGEPPVFLCPWMEEVATLLSLGGLLGLAVCALSSARRRAADEGPPAAVT
ncbi:MAG: hypothetical protein ACP5E5_07355 [Acidobacteriaceae bacterium]